jgi:hypothetical protein
MNFLMVSCDLGSSYNVEILCVLAYKDTAF